MFVAKGIIKNRFKSSHLLTEAWEEFAGDVNACRCGTTKFSIFEVIELE